MNCQDAREWFSARLDDALTADDRARLDAHLAGCADCRRELDRLRQTVALLREMQAPRAPAGFVDRVLEATRPSPRPGRVGDAGRRLLRGRVPLSAAALVVGATLAVYVFERTPELQRAARHETPAAIREQEPAAASATRAERSPGSDPAVSASPRVPAPPPAAFRSAEEPTGDDARRHRSIGGHVSRGAVRPPDAPPSDTGRAEQKSMPLPPSPAPSPEGARQSTEAPSAPRPPAPSASDGARSADAPAPASPRDGRPEPPKEELRAERPALSETQPRPEPEPSQMPRGSSPPSTESLSPPRQRRAIGPTPSAARLLPTPGVRGRLVVKERLEAERELVRIATAVGGAEVGRRSGDDGAITLYLIVPHSRYAEFSSALARVGSWQSEEEPAELPARVLISIRISQ